ncbi:MAG TPA: ABC transporter ATP-binding protein [Euzebyales bacterium]|nr:ABC transporter ATP-binding protein [Euzebyales bacterium]
MLTLDSVSKVYNVGTFGSARLRAVRDVSFTVEPGQIVSLIGESGSGKSTIGKMILGLLRPTSGTIDLNGTDVGALGRRDLKAYYRNVQGVFQDPFSAFNPIFKAERVFAMIREQYFPGVDDGTWRAKLEGALSAVGLSPEVALGRYPHQMSGGQLQRLLVARALLLDIGFLVADEITSMLDASTRIDVLNMLADLTKRDLSVLFITHDLNLGYYISDRTVILYRGAVVEMGDTARIFDNPLHPYTKMLMASVPRLDAMWGPRDDVSVDSAADAHVVTDGCVYYGRCPIGSRDLGCHERHPALVEAEDDHLVACYAVERDLPLPWRARNPARAS